MSFNDYFSTKHFILFIVVIISWTGIPFLSTLNDGAYFKQVFPYVGWIVLSCFTIGLINQYWVKSGYLTFLVFILNPMLWGIMGAGAIWYVRIFELDWLWWIIYPGLYLLSYLPQIVFSKWWQANDKLIVKISLWAMLIPPAFFGGRYARYNFRLMESQGTMPYYASLKLSDWAILLVSTVGGLGFAMAFGRGLWQDVQKFEKRKREAKNG